jgi:hypothetical protein
MGLDFRRVRSPLALRLDADLRPTLLPFQRSGSERTNFVSNFTVRSAIHKNPE